MAFDRDIRICVPVNRPSLETLFAAALAASEIADVIELRIDGLNPSVVDHLSGELDQLLHNIPRPAILTYRPAEQGGYRAVGPTERRAFWHKHFNSDSAFLDLESDLVQEFVQLEPDAQPDWSRVICSHHDFGGVPENLDQLYEQMSFGPARIIKIAVKAKDAVECLPVFKLLERAKRDEREIIAIAMGQAGAMTRILGPSRGSFLTYGAGPSDAGTAPGQLPATELDSVYRVKKIDADTVITGLVGFPVFHSVSPHMHNAAFEATGLNGVYLPFQVQNLGGFVNRMVHPRTREMTWNLRGLSVTAPHKTEVMNYLDWVEPRATRIGAVNTIVVENGRLHGYNTDADGFISPLLKRLGSLAGLRAAVIGSGGAASSSVFALQEHQVDVTLFARNLEKARLIGERFNISYELLTNACFTGQDIVINATPLGSLTSNVEDTPVHAEQLHGSKLVYDLVYNPIETRFLFEAREAGCDVLGGLEMLVDQARLQFKIWTELDVSSELMYTAGSTPLSKSFSSVM